MIGYRTRLKLVTFGGLAGWFTGFLAAIPAEVVTGVRDSQGEPRLLAATLVMGLTVWAVWTFLLAAAAWLLLAVPCVLIFPPAFLVRWQRRVVWLAGLSAVTLALLKTFPFRDYATSKLVTTFDLLMQYGLFAFFFAVVTPWLYLRLARRVLAEG